VRVNKAKVKSEKAKSICELLVFLLFTFCLLLLKGLKGYDIESSDHHAEDFGSALRQRLC
jgi:hypothetical protein